MQKDNKIKDSYKQKKNLSPSNSIITNPIDKSGLVAKINILGSGMNSVNSSHGIINHHSEKAYCVVDYAGFIKETNDIIKRYYDIKVSLNAFHNMFTSRLNCAYTALGLINEASSSVNIKLLTSTTCIIDSVCPDKNKSSIAFIAIFPLSL